MYWYNALTEWIFWDRIKVSDIVEIDYNDYAHPRRGLEDGWRLHLNDVFPQVFRAGHSRSERHARMYHSLAELAEIETSIPKHFARRLGPLPVSTTAMKRDKRILMDTATLKKIWQLANRTCLKDVLFIDMLSWTFKTHCFESTVHAVIRDFPDVVARQLYQVCKDRSPSSESLLVHYMPKRKTGRIDIDSRQQLMEALIKGWAKREKLSVNASETRQDVYIVFGSARPQRNLKKLEQQGLQGGCTVTPVLQNDAIQTRGLSYEEIKILGAKVVLDETDEEHKARLKAVWHGRTPACLVGTSYGSTTRVRRNSLSTAAASANLTDSSTLERNTLPGKNDDVASKEKFSRPERLREILQQRAPAIGHNSAREA